MMMRNLFYLLLLAIFAGCSSGGSNFVVTQGANPAPTFNGRLTGQYFAVGSTLLQNTNGRESNFAAGLNLQGDGNITAGSTVNIVQHQGVANGFHNGGSYAVNATGGFDATINTILGPIVLNQGQSLTNLGNTSRLVFGNFSMDNGNTTGRALIVERRSGIGVANLNGQFSFQGINVTDSTTKGADF